MGLEALYQEWDRTAALGRMVRDGKASIVSPLQEGKAIRRFTRLHPGESVHKELERMKAERGEKSTEEI